MIKKLIWIMGDVILYFVIILIVEFVFVKIGWSDGPIVGSAIGVTIGWCIWRIIYHAIKKKSQRSN